MSKPGLHVGNNPDGTRIEVPFEVVARERIKVLQDEIAAVVDVGMNPTEREGLAALLQRVTLARVLGLTTPAHEWATIVLLDSLSWAENAMALGAVVAARCMACESLEELDAVVVDLSALGPPPTITAGEIALALQEP